MAQDLIIFWQFDEQKTRLELCLAKIFPDFFLKFFKKN